MNTAAQESTLRTDSAVTEPHQGLVLPRIPDAIYDEDHEGLLPLTLLGKPLRVEFEGWLAIRPGHTCQLLLDDVLIGELKTITTENPGEPLVLEVPAEYLVEGVFAVAYRATNTYNNVYEDSATVRLEIVTTAPGLPKLAPMKFADEIECGLTSAELTRLGEQLVAEVGSYAGIYQLDQIKTFWGDIEGPGAVVSKTATGLERIYITYSRAFLLSLGEFDGQVTYTVTDRAGNVSEPSLGTHIQLLLNDVPECAKQPVTADSISPARSSSQVVDITVRVQSTVSTQPK